MKKYLLAAVAVAAIASPAYARDGQPYFGIEGGVMFPKDQDADANVNFLTFQSVPTTPAVAGPADFTTEDAFGLDYKRGLDVDLIGGYDFGLIRAEIELGYKRAKLNEIEIDNGFIDELNAGLNRPDVDIAPDTIDPLLPLSSADFDVDGRIKIWSGMINALFDFGNEDGLSFYAGGGFGRARAKLLGRKDKAWAGQLIAGVRYAVSPNIDIGLKYRYFRTGKLDFTDDTDALLLEGNPETVAVGGGEFPTLTDVTTNAVVATDFEQRFRSHSLLASLIFNFGGADRRPRRLRPRRLRHRHRRRRRPARTDR